MKGLAFLLVLIFVFVLAVGATAFIALSNNELRMVKRQSESTRAFYIAEGGFERARSDLEKDDDWTDGEIAGTTYDKSNVDADGYYLLNYDSATRTSLGGEFTIRLKDITGEVFEIWVKSQGVFNNLSRTIVGMVQSSRRLGNPAGVTSAIEAEGEIDVKGSAEVNGDILEETNLSFEDIFGATVEEMRQIAQTHYSDTYYTTAFSNNTATQVTWIESNDDDPEITTTGWNGSGILIVEDDLRITGGTFNGVIWVIGSLTISGNPTINGGIFVQCSVDTDTSVKGNATVNYDSTAVGNAFYVLTLLPSGIEDWQEAE